MTGTQVPISHPNREDDNFILFGGSPLAPGHRGEQVGQPQGRGHQQDQQRSSGPVGRSLFYQTNLLLLETHSALLFDALHKTNRTQENRHEISELEKTVRSLRQVMANQDYAPLVYHVDGRITTPTRPWIHRWRDLQGGYHVTPYEPPNTNPAGYPYQHRADGAQPLRQVAKDLDWQLHSNLRRYLPDMEWCVVCGNWHYVQEARSVDILLWEAFGDENGLLPDEYPIDGQVMQLPSLPMCLEWAQFWDWGIIGLVPGRTPGSWMTKVVHPDFIQFMASNYPGAEGREINVSSSWQPNPRHLYLRWAVTELLRIHDEGVARPVAPARGVLSWENSIADYETGPLGCDMTMMVTWLGYELAGLAPEETCALFDIPEELEQRAKDQLNMEWARQFWTPRFKRFIDAYLGWNAVVSKELAQYRQQMVISPGVSRVDDGEADQRLREVLGEILADEDEEPQIAEEQTVEQDENEEVAGGEKTGEKTVHQENVEEVDVETPEEEETGTLEELATEAEIEGEKDEEEKSDEDTEEQLEFQSSDYNADVEGYFDDWGEEEGSNWNQTTDDGDRVTTSEEDDGPSSFGDELEAVMDLIETLARDIVDSTAP
ncbi:hypothetical protein MCOR29_007529 [Pyricularia oryzae]|nr:hypothetical protein MCOR29_007529 [Pyricularia oryzae]KAI6371763.1 hypothetical protein MCOR32_006124 [Pyricularia oryzae]KAI6496047.1 hypothetical protein MCOR11_005073 [Pyricularia oryzae]KAI6529271.1 hypothetical protein MCOR05_008116 [Pyricularia oryzae]KAI6532986.1 hypothetical protein MCOR10_002732 [Pyricularia oryzae]